MHDNYAAISATGNGGVVYLYKLIDGLLELTQELRPINTTNSIFGYSLAMQASTLLVSKLGNVVLLDVSAGTLGLGAYPKGEVLVFDRVDYGGNASVWQEAAVIRSPIDGDFSFGMTIALHGESVLIGTALFPDGEGSAFTYSRTNNNDTLPSSALVNNTLFVDTNLTLTAVAADWQLNQTFSSPAGTQGYFGASVAMTDTHIAIGADGFNAIQGVVYLGTVIPRATVSPTSMPTSMPTTVEPTSTPTSVPTATPTMKPSQVAAAAGSGIVAADQSVQKQAKTAVVVIAVFACVVVLIVLAVAIICCCLYRNNAIAGDGKKKKKEEEDSPYTVYGPYDRNIHNQPVEQAEEYYPMPMPYMHYPMPMPMPMLYPPMPYPMYAPQKSMEDVKKKDDSNVPGDQPGAYSVDYTPRWPPPYMQPYAPWATDKDKKEQGQGKEGADAIISNNLQAMGLMPGPMQVPYVPYPSHYPMPMPYAPYPYSSSQQMPSIPEKEEYIDTAQLSAAEINFVSQLFDPGYVRALYQMPGHAPMPWPMPQGPEYMPEPAPSMPGPSMPGPSMSADLQAHGMIRHASSDDSTVSTTRRPFASMAASMLSINSEDSIHSVNSILGRSAEASTAAVTSPERAAAPQPAFPPSAAASPRVLMTPVRSPPPVIPLSAEPPLTPTTPEGIGARRLTPLRIPSANMPNPSPPGSFFLQPQTENTSWDRVMYEQRLQEEEARRMLVAVASVGRRAMQQAASSPQSPSHQPASPQPQTSPPPRGLHREDSLEKAESGAAVPKTYNEDYWAYENVNSSASQEKIYSPGKAPEDPAPVVSDRDRNKLLKLQSMRKHNEAKKTKQAAQPAPSSPMRPVAAPSSNRLDRFVTMEEEEQPPSPPAPVPPPAAADEPSPFVSDRLQTIRERFDVYRQRAQQRRTSFNQPGKPSADP